ncbi:crossover junction endodeoxyribonuclease RuvC [Eisenibacter elegans]|jgi:crossover junction endodeoxyribonuclease RuvC|uniref:crossover junction endodeoxyribonuclease RuvC n=1 Tax=Eisenibacter elegans TaxID=997 RepID=UPI0004050C2C|nr:crossover junction endodeoxyribonuclease RuvC [Eisenibacter elegans]
MSDTAIQEKIIMGIDPGTRVMGYGLIRVVPQRVELLQYGIIRLVKYTEQAQKLKKIYERISAIIEEYAPDEVALEAPFLGENIQVAIKLGRAQGVAMAAALARDIPITEYAPRKVKQSVTGNGNASKEQVAAMLPQLIYAPNLQKIELDATDAIGVALCHHFQANLPQTKNKGWSHFIQQNPDRIR